MLRFAVVIIVAGAMLIWTLQQRNHTMLTITNQSGQTITVLEVKAGEHAATFPNIAPGSAVPVPFVTRSDVSVVVDCKFADDRSIRYTGQLPPNLRLPVGPDGNFHPEFGAKE
jgi:hypothetical protein